MNIYNEIDPFAAQWLQNLIDAGYLPRGYVSERSIVRLQPENVKNFAQAHFFAGIGVWSYALRQAGWPDDRPVWTGSCPCQPFSSAGRRKGVKDPRHLWSEWFRLIEECHPPVILGEQVASPDGLKWLDLVFADLERAGYAFGAADLCAAGVGAPHIRQRLYFVAVANGERRKGLGVQLSKRKSRREVSEARGGGENDWLADRSGDGRGKGRTDGRRGEGRVGSTRLEGSGFTDYRTSDGVADSASRAGGRGLLGESSREDLGWQPSRAPGKRDTAASSLGVGDAGRQRPSERPRSADGRGALRIEGTASAAPGAWDDVEWLPCQDGKERPTQPGIHPLAHGATNRVGKLRAYGNALCAPVAVTFIRAVMDIL